MTLEEWERSVRQVLKEGSPVIFHAKISPHSPRTQLIQLLCEEPLTIKISVHAAPEKGKANAELLSFLCREFGCSAEILTGHTAGLKRVKLNPIE